MSTTSSPFEKKGIFHSHLVHEGKIEALIMSPPQKSKFKDKGDYIDLKIGGKDHSLTIENDAIGEKLKGLKGCMVTLEATGSREEADIEIAIVAQPGGRALDAKTGATPRGTPAPRGDAPPSPDTIDLKHIKIFLLQHAKARLLAFKAAQVVVAHFDGPESVMTPDAIGHMASNFYIALDRQNYITALPIDDLLEHKKPEPERPAPKPAPKPKPKQEPPQPKAAPIEPAPDDDEIPF